MSVAAVRAGEERVVRSRTAMWLGLAVVVLHNLEEVLGARGFLDARRDALPAFLRGMTVERFGASLVLVTLIVLVVTRAAARSRPRGAWLLAAVAMHAGMGFNAIQHGALALWCRGYAPGAITGATLTLPFAIWIGVRAVRSGWVGGRPLAIATAAMVGMTLPLLAGLHLLSGAVLGGG